MTTPILFDTQIIHDPNGNPAFVVIPYDQYIASIKMRELDLTDGVPSEVVDIFFDNQGYTAVRAWREYLGYTQQQIAERLDISQSAYSQHEKSQKLRKSTRQKIANALGINAQQLDF